MKKAFADLVLSENFQLKMHSYRLLPFYITSTLYVVLLFINNEALSLMSAKITMNYVYYFSVIVIPNMLQLCTTQPS
jgi:hypothetical protein